MVFDWRLLYNGICLYNRVYRGDVDSTSYGILTTILLNFESLFCINSLEGEIVY